MIKAGVITFIQVLVLFFLNVFIAYIIDKPLNYDGFLISLIIIVLWSANEAKDTKA